MHVYYIKKDNTQNAYKSNKSDSRLWKAAFIYNSCGYKSDDFLMVRFFNDGA